MQRVLVLTAMPLELRPLLAAAGVSRDDGVAVGNRTCYAGAVGTTDVVLAMTGIGLVNAERTAVAALEHFGSEIEAVVFCGVAGSTAAIGDVVVPAKWTLDGGSTWLPVDPFLLAAADALVAEVVLGDATAEVRLPHQPVLRTGGDGTSGDPFDGEALAPSPGGGDVFGADPWVEPGDAALAEMALGGDAFPGIETPDAYAAQDMETAAVAVVAAARGVPFLGVRGVSDGTGDPLGLPGFPAQFVVYRQLAADNAAAVTVALLASRPPQRVR